MHPVPFRCQLFQCTSQTFLSGFRGGGIFASDQVRVIGVINPRTSRNPAGKGCRLAPIPPLGPIAWGQYDGDGDGLAPIGKYAVVLVCSDFPIAIFHHVIAELCSIAGQVRE